MSKKRILILIISAVFAFPLVAEPYYDAGSQMFSISVGTNVPLTLSTFVDDEFKTGIGPGSADGTTNQTMGVFGSIDYEVFLHSYFSIGAEIGYQFNFTPSKKILTNVPIFLKMTTIPIQTGKFDLPISLGLGFDYISFNGSSKFTINSSLLIGLKYFITDEWGIGINTGLTLTPELYAEKSKNALFTYIPINAVVTYRH